MGRKLLNIFLFVLLSGIGAYAQDMIPVYLEPSPQSPILTLLRFDDPVIQDSSAISNSEKAKKGWRVAKYNGNFRGFVSGDQITRSGEIKDGSSVYLRKSKDSMVLTSISNADAYIIIRKGEWVEIDFEKPVSVYFQDDRFYAQVPKSPETPLSLPQTMSNDTDSARILGETPNEGELKKIVDDLPNNVIDDLPEPLIEPYNEEDAALDTNEIIAESNENPVSQKRNLDITGNEEIKMINPGEMQTATENEVIIEDEELPELDPIGGDDFDAEELTIKKPTIKPPSTLSRRLEGRLIHKPSSLLIKRPYEYQLETADGRMIAYVDTAGLRVHKVHAYRDLFVILNGRLDSIDKSSRIVIRAQTMRLRP